MAGKFRRQAQAGGTGEQCLGGQPGGGPPAPGGGHPRGPHSGHLFPQGSPQPARLCRQGSGSLPLHVFTTHTPRIVRSILSCLFTCEVWCSLNCLWHTRRLGEVSQVNRDASRCHICLCPAVGQADLDTGEYGLNIHAVLISLVWPIVMKACCFCSGSFTFAISTAARLHTQHHVLLWLHASSKVYYPAECISAKLTIVMSSGDVLLAGLHTRRCM